MKKLVSTGLNVLRDQGPITTARMSNNFVKVRLRQNYNRRFGKIKKKSVYDEDWDALVILDACRYDLMNEVYTEYEFLSEPSKYTSPGSHSKEWMTNSFTNDYAEEMSNTVHITANPFSEEVLSESDFQVLDEVWKHSWDQNLGTVHPKKVTDRAIELGRETEADRYIIHYMQPHFPSINKDLVDFTTGENPAESWGEEVFENPWRQLEMGLLEEDMVWDAYTDNLKSVLDSVRDLVANFDAPNTVITADHGNAKGENGVYGHPEYLNLDCLRVVPWIRTESVDNNSIQPENNILSEDEQTDIKEKLSDLGYA